MDCVVDNSSKSFDGPAALFNDPEPPATFVDSDVLPLASFSLKKVMAEIIVKWAEPIFNKTRLARWRARVAPKKYFSQMRKALILCYAKFQPDRFSGSKIAD